MSRSFFYKAALVLALVSLIPLVIFLSRRESPPEKISVRLHQKQTVENFTLNSTGQTRWVLKAPVAVFREKDLIELTSPVLTVFRTPPVTVRAGEALFDRKRGILTLRDVYLETGQLRAFSPGGTYLIDKEIFKSSSGCRVVAGSSTTEGKNCTLLIPEREVIITQQVKTVISGEGK